MGQEDPDFNEWVNRLIRPTLGIRTARPDTPFWEAINDQKAWVKSRTAKNNARKAREAEGQPPKEYSKNPLDSLAKGRGMRFDEEGNMIEKGTIAGRDAYIEELEEDAANGLRLEEYRRYLKLQDALP
jgi:hypothetical protein